MPILLTPIVRLTPDQTPVTIRAAVRAIRPGRGGLMINEGVIRDETGEIAFTVWESSGIKKLEAGRQYVFHRADIGRRDGRIEVRLQEGASALLLSREEDLPRILYRLSRGEQSFRGGLGRRAPRRGRSRRNVYSALITAGLALWLGVMALVYTGVLSEKKIKDYLRFRKTAAQKKAMAYSRSGRVTEIVDRRTIAVRTGEETLRVHFLGLDLPAGKGPEKAAPLDLRTANFVKFLLVGKEVRLEFEPSLPPEQGQAIAYVFAGDRMANLALLEKGMARLLPEAEKLGHGPEMKRAEDSARSSKLGVWAVNR